MSVFLDLDTEEIEIAAEDQAECEGVFCSFALSEKNLVHQGIYICQDCDKDSGRCCCSGCADVCHKGHNISFLAFGRGYCDCGADGCSLVSHSYQKSRDLLKFSSSTSVALDTHGRILDTVRIGLDVKPFVEYKISSIPDLLVWQSKELVSRSKETFWLSAEALSTPRCLLEAFASNVFAFHTQGLSYDPSRSGAEWWVQVKQLDTEENCSIDLHYDKDEEIAEAFSVGVFPQISTVSYLSETSLSQPTLIFETTASEPIGESIRTVYLSRSTKGKHISFDGRYLHGAPWSPIVNSFGSNPCAVKADGSSRMACDGHVDNFVEVALDSFRVTFLVNVWLHHHPSGAQPLPEDIVTALNELAGGMSHLVSRTNEHGCVPFIESNAATSHSLPEIVVTRRHLQVEKEKSQKKKPFQIKKKPGAKRGEDAEAKKMESIPGTTDCPRHYLYY